MCERGEASRVLCGSDGVAAGQATPGLGDGRWTAAARSARRDSPETVAGEPADHALGRSRGGWSTKAHLAMDQRRGVLACVLTAGHTGDGPLMVPVLDHMRVVRPGPGRPRIRPDRVLADKPYSSRANRAWLDGHGIRANIPIKADQAAFATHNDRPAVRFDATLTVANSTTGSTVSPLGDWLS